MGSLITPMDIEAREFARKMRGYDPHEVRLFLRAIAEEIERQNLEQGRLLEELGQLRTDLEEVRRNERTLQQTLVAAQQLAEEMKERARAEGELIVKQARVEADRLLDATRAERTRLEADIRSAEADRAALESDLEGVIDRHLRLIETRREGRDLGGASPPNVRVLTRRTGSEAG